MSICPSPSLNTPAAYNASIFSGVDTCWFEDNPTLTSEEGGGCGWKAGSGLGSQKLVIPVPIKIENDTTRVNLEAENGMCTNVGGCIKRGKDLNSTDFKPNTSKFSCSYDSDCKDKYDDKDYTCIPAGAQPWRKYVKRPNCIFRPAIKNDVGEGLKGIGRSLLGMIPGASQIFLSKSNLDEYKQDIESAKGQMQMTAQHMSEIIAKKTVKNQLQEQQEMRKYQQLNLLQMQLLEENLNFDEQKDNLLFNVISVLIAILVLFELL